MSNADADFRAQLLDALPALRRFALVYCRSKADADDMVQSTVERALLKQAQWSRKSPLRSWLFSILRNRWHDEQRGRRNEVDEEYIDTEKAQKDSNLTTLEFERVHEKILRLPEKHREVLLLVAVEGMSYRETAECLGVPTGTVMSRLARARSALLKDMGANNDA